MLIPAGVQRAQTIPEAFFAQVNVCADRVAFEWKDGNTWRRTTFGEYGALVAAAARAFRHLGLTPGDCVAVWGETTPEWSILDLAVMTAGGHTAGIYQTCTAEQAAFILRDSGAKFLCMDSLERLALARSVRSDTPNLQRFLLWGDDAPEKDDVLPFAAFLEIGREQSSAVSLEELLRLATPESYASLVYTSGTTGTPKGVVLDQANCMACCRAILEQSDLLRDDDTTVSYLPLSHVAEHVSFLARIYGAITTYYCPDMSQLGQVMREKSPTYVFGVPRVFEKVQQRMLSAIEQAPPRKQRLARWALAVGQEASAAKLSGKPLTGWKRLRLRLADRLVLSKLRGGLGGKLRFVVSGAAPMDVEGILFFESLGIAFIEAYGLSESAGISHINRAHTRRPGTVGQPAAGVECRIAEDGEILLRSPMVFRGYLNNPEATREVLDEDGWLHTGDIGEVDAEGYLRITDRKKNLLITAGGKNVAPASIELLLQRDPLVSQVVVLGDRRPFLVALIAANQEIIEAERLNKEAVEARVAAAVEAANLGLARYEQIKRWRLVSQEFSIETGEMTPTMKIKRAVILDHYQDLVAELYAADVEQRPGGA